MFGFVRDLSGSISALQGSLVHVSEVLDRVLGAWDSQGPLQERLAELERNRDQWEAAMEALQMRADSTFKSARSAEERTKTLARNAEALAGGEEGEDGISDEFIELLRRNAEAGAGEEVHTLPAGVAVNSRTAALNAKWGRVV